MLELVVFLLLILLSYAGVAGYRRYALQQQILDHPNDRSSHNVITPRGGGVVFVLGWLLLVSVAAYFYQVLIAEWLLFFLPVMMISAVGFCDDRYSLNILLRAFVHFVAAIIVLILLGGISTIYFSTQIVELGIGGNVFVVLAIVWSTNLFNFMDGLDGFATVEAIFLFTMTTLLIYLTVAEVTYFLWLMLGLVALLIGFLIWNWPRAKIFMGDVGSGFLGLVYIVAVCYAVKNFHLPVLLFIFLYGFFLFDATLTLLRRVFHGDKWYQSHRLHAYQRLHQSGFSHSQVLMVNMGINLLIGILVITAYYQPSWMIISGGIEFLILVIYYLWVEKRKPMFGAANAQVF